MDGLQEQDVLIVILLGTVVVLILVAGIVLFILLYQRRILTEKQKLIQQELTYQSQMIKLQLESQEQERKRIGADLHDSLGSLLWGAKVNASLIQRSTELKDNALISYKELTQILDESIEAVRRISWELTPEAFHYSGLSESVRKLCQRLDGKGKHVIFADVEEKYWNDDRALQAFRIIQELVNNAMKHSGASTISVSIVWSDVVIQVSVIDNGSGFDAQQQKSGVGLWNVDQRIRQLNGKIHMGNPPIGTGLVVNLEIPLSSL